MKRLEHGSASYLKLSMFSSLATLGYQYLSIWQTHLRWWSIRWSIKAHLRWCGKKHEWDIKSANLHPVINMLIILDFLQFRILFFSTSYLSSILLPFPSHHAQPLRKMQRFGQTVPRVHAFCPSRSSHLFRGVSRGLPWNCRNAWNLMAIHL